MRQESARRHFLGRLAAAGQCSMAGGAVVGPTTTAPPSRLHHSIGKDAKSRQLCSSPGGQATAEGHLRCRRSEWSLWRRLPHVAKSAGLLGSLTQLQGALAKPAFLAVPQQGWCCILASLSESTLSQLQVAKVKLPTQPVAVCVNRNSSSEALVSMKEGPPILVDLAMGTRREVPCIPSGQCSALRLIRLQSTPTALPWASSCTQDGSCRLTQAAYYPQSVGNPPQ